jgi:hypothetical protein
LKFLVGRLNYLSSVDYEEMDSQLSYIPLHGHSIADLKFPAKVSERLIKEGYVSPHHVIPKSGWVSHEIRDAKDVEKAIELFRLQYDRLVKSK